MKPLHVLTASQQVAQYLKNEIGKGVWTEFLPGENLLINELQIGRNTIRGALEQLENEGLVVSDGPGKRRRIVGRKKASVQKNLRVRILLYEKQDQGDADISMLLVELREAGFDVEFASKSLHDLGMDVDRVARHVDKNPADAWITSSCSREVNQWFSKQPVPVLAMYGRYTGLEIASAFPTLAYSMIDGVRRMIDLGHKRIVMFVRAERRKPVMGYAERLFVDELEAAGIETSGYHLPDWEESSEGLCQRLDQLFQITPPTAIIFQEVPLAIAARCYLSDRGIVSPRDVSLMVTDYHPCLEWSKPLLAHLEWEYRPVVRRIVRWAQNVARGKEDLQQVGTPSRFIEGGTIGHVPIGRGVG